MTEFTIYCTPEQIKRALQVGAPIELQSEYYHPTEHDLKLDNPIPCESYTYGYHCAKCPTAEQMIGWLRSKGFRFKIEELSDTITAYRVTFGYWYKVGQSSNPKGATFAVIDAALEYVIKRSL